MGILSRLQVSATAPKSKAGFERTVPGSLFSGSAEKKIVLLQPLYNYV